MDDEYKQLHSVFAQIFIDMNKQIYGVKMNEDRPNDQDRFEYEHQRQQEEDDNVPSN